MPDSIRVVRSARFAVTAAFLLVALLTLAACGGASAPPTPTPSPTPSPTPEPTATPVPATATEAEPATAPAATPQVTIPDGFTPELDEVRGYSLALPGGWTNLDLRGRQFRNMAGTFGLGDAMAPLIQFLESPEGDAVGIVAMTDLGGVMFGGLPTLLNVSVLDAPGATPEQVREMVAQLLEDNAALLGDLNVETLDVATVNNLPAVVADATGDLASVGMDAQLYAKVVGLIANDKVYVLTLATEAGNRADKEPVFAEIIGTFRPE